MRQLACDQVRYGCERGNGTALGALLRHLQGMDTEGLKHAETDAIGQQNAPGESGENGAKKDYGGHGGS